MNELELVLIPLITGLCELIKQVGLPKRWIPLVAVALGVAFGVLFLYPSDILKGVLAGMIMGLSSIGLYSGPKNLFKFKGGNKDVHYD